MSAYALVIKQQTQNNNFIFIPCRGDGDECHCQIKDFPTLGPGCNAQNTVFHVLVFIATFSCKFLLSYPRGCEISWGHVPIAMQTSLESVYSAHTHNYC